MQAIHMKFLVLGQEKGKKKVLKSVYKSSSHVFAPYARRRTNFLRLKFGLRTSRRPFK
jgi:hypothetical protein